MRNGNPNENKRVETNYVGSYPTYEEWKLFEEKQMKVVNVSSYPTYEEWKLSTDLSNRSKV